jgi:tetratricopeptide (TPR) repeat protein
MMGRRALVIATLVAAGGCAHPSAAGAGASADRGGGLQRSAPTVAELVDRGRAFAAIGDLTRAEQYLSASLDRGADPERVLPVLVRVCLEAGRYRVAGEYVRQSLRRDPENDRLHLLSGLLEAAVGNRQVALREFEIVLRTRPDDSEGHYGMAVLLRDSGDDAAEADAHFRAYLRLTPEGVHAADARSSLLGVRRPFDCGKGADGAPPCSLPFEGSAAAPPEEVP